MTPRNWEPPFRLPPLASPPLTQELNMTKPTAMQAIDALINAIITVRKCRLTKDQMGRAEAILEIAKSMQLNDNDVLHGILLELNEMTGIGNADEQANGDDAVEYLKNLRVDILQHLGHADDLPIPALVEPALAERVLRT